jgi:hypothetical protein
MSGAVSTLFGDDDLYTTAAVRAFTNRVRRVSRQAANEIEAAAEELHTILSNVPGNPVLFGHDSKHRANRVVEPLRHAVSGYHASSNLAVLTWVRFQKAFAPELEGITTKKGRQFNFGDA